MKLVLYFLVILNVSTIKLLAQQYLRDDSKDLLLKPNNKIPIITYRYADYIQWLKDNKMTIRPPDNYQIDREKIFSDNLKKINEHNIRYNSGLESSFQGLTQFTDWTEKEFEDFVKPGINYNFPTSNNALKFDPNRPRPLPIILDYKRQGYLTPIKNQFDLRSSAVFSVVSVLEGQYYKMTGELNSLSEQYVIDCSEFVDDSKSDITKSVVDIFKFLNSTFGIPSDDVYSYEAQKKECVESDRVKFKIADIRKIDSNSLRSVVQVLASVGPVVAFLSVPSDFKNFTGGLITDTKFCNGIPNHAVTLVGYNKQALVFRNSWGEDWGESGYFRISKSKCQFNETPIYALIDLDNNSKNILMI